MAASLARQSSARSLRQRGCPWAWVHSPRIFTLAYFCGIYHIYPLVTCCMMYPLVNKDSYWTWPYIGNVNVYQRVTIENGPGEMSLVFPMKIAWWFSFHPFFVHVLPGRVSTLGPLGNVQIRMGGNPPSELFFVHSYEDNVSILWS